MGTGAEGTTSARCNACMCIPSTENPLCECFRLFKQRLSRCRIVGSAAIFASQIRSILGSPLDKKWLSSNFE